MKRIALLVLLCGNAWPQGAGVVQVNPIVRQYNLAPGDSWLLPAGTVLLAMQNGSAELLIAQGDNTANIAFWGFNQGDTWPLDGNTTIKNNAQSGIISFQAAECTITAGGAAGLLQSMNIAIYAAGVCK